MKKSFLFIVAVGFLTFGCAQSKGKTDIPNNFPYRLTLSEA
ncbi:MAG: hypothetical protein ABI778_07210 [Ignavibacteriota bacterium]